jgi:hypothetical protein
MKDNLKKIKYYLYQKIFEYDHDTDTFWEESAADVVFLIQEIEEENYETIRDQLDVLEALHQI